MEKTYLVLIVRVRVVGEVFEGAPMVGFPAEGELERGGMVGFVASCAMTRVQRVGILEQGDLRAGFERVEEVAAPGGGCKFAACQALDFVVEFMEGGLVFCVVAREGGVEFVVNHPFDGVLEVFDRLLVGVAGILEGHACQVSRGADGGVFIFNDEVFIVLIEVFACANGLVVDCFFGHFWYIAFFIVG